MNLAGKGLVLVGDALQQAQQVVRFGIVGRSSDELMPVGTIKATSESHIGFRAVGSTNVVTVPQGQLQLPDYFGNWKSFGPAAICSDANVGNVVVRVIVGGLLVDANNAFSRHLRFPPYF